ncbi:MAG TPA: hypothetical protein VMH00_10560 [Candidatus Limnocylindrales bacterium]|nr:hypothetical protein [Candidatus Limnocylindrales bacterium]
MIGVTADPANREVVCEFFELFKTPWEFCRPGGQYDVLLCEGNREAEATAKLVVHYSGVKLPLDDQRNIRTQQRSAGFLTFQGARIPVYGQTITFPSMPAGPLAEEVSGECAACLDESSDRLLARVGYDLFSEIRILLTSGQPPANAQFPALDLHIAFLRNLIVGSGISLVEIPPAPDGYPFVACLTHDVDHPSLRPHKWDHTMFGFLYRAVFDSLRKFLSGRLSFRGMLRNWTAALKLPFVHLGVAKDFWREFDDQYLELEKGLASTFFVIPYSGRPGKTVEGSAPSLRASGYGARDIEDAIRKLNAAGCEVGLHGIDAWIDEVSGRREIEEIQVLTRESEIGVRMHWLYFDERSPSTLDRAGAVYDSTVGYNGAVGYRAGTTQAYKPLGATSLIELPLNVMDTALFYPDRLGLSKEGAKALLRPIVDNAVRFGGVLTINWHDRSLAPERLWGDFYRDLVDELKSRGAWFATAGQAASWFRKRRSARFEGDTAWEPAGRPTLASDDDAAHVPGLRLRLHRRRVSALTEVREPEDYAVGNAAKSSEPYLPSNLNK